MSAPTPPGMMATLETEQDDRATALRTLVLWVPDWPVIAAHLHAASPGAGGRRAPLDPHATPRVVMQGNRVLAASRAAQQAGVRRGQRLREAQSACPDLSTVRSDPQRDARAFDAVVQRLTLAMPGWAVLRPGLATLHARGPRGYFGSETAAGLAAQAAAAAALHGLITPDPPPGSLAPARNAAGTPAEPISVWVGIADTPFAAEHAARAAQGARHPETGLWQRPRPGVGVVTPGADARFLAPLPVEVLAATMAEVPEAIPLWRRLGIDTLGQLAALDAGAMASRFGSAGARAQLLARGQQLAALPAVHHSDEVSETLEFDEPLHQTDLLAFSVRPLVDRFQQRLLPHRIATVVRVEVRGGEGGLVERSWAHPVAFEATELVDRIRWTVEHSARPQGSASGRPSPAPAAPASTDQEHPGSLALVGGISAVTLTAEAIARSSDRESGLWGATPTRVPHALARVQSLLGHSGVLLPVIEGGRGPAERVQLHPWGEKSPTPAAGPWPGALPSPAPSTVLQPPRPVDVLDAAGRTVTVSVRDELSRPPHQLVIGSRVIAAQGWAGPWPVHPSDGAAPRWYLQIGDPDGIAWLVHRRDDDWWLEGRYD